MVRVFTPEKVENATNQEFPSPPPLPWQSQLLNFHQHTTASFSVFLWASLGRCLGLQNIAKGHLQKRKKKSSCVFQKLPTNGDIGLYQQTGPHLNAFWKGLDKTDPPRLSAGARLFWKALPRVHALPWNTRCWLSTETACPKVLRPHLHPQVNFFQSLCPRDWVFLPSPALLCVLYKAGPWPFLATPSAVSVPSMTHPEVQPQPREQQGPTPSGHHCILNSQHSADYSVDTW